jgi:hypothetical protein
MKLDRIKKALANFVESCLPRIDYLATYPGRVVAQGGTNSFDFQPDSTKVPGVSGVPVRFGLPGVSVQLALGSSPRATLAFAEGDPAQGFLDLWEQPGLSSLTVDPSATVNLGPAAAAVGRVGDQVQVTFSIADAALILTGAGPGSPCSAVGPITLTGTITAGSPKVNA